MKDLKETLFQAARLEQNAAAKATEAASRRNAAVCFYALYAVIEEAGLIDEYIEYVNGYRKR